MTKKQISFSVVVPLYNTEKYVPDLLESLLNQKPGDYQLEFIFIDDGSKDSSAAITQKWLSDNSLNGKVLRQANMGVSVARNRGIREATGEWVSLPDSDDFISENYFFELSKNLVNFKTAPLFISCNVIRYDEEKNTFEDIHPLRFKFASGSRTFSMLDEPQHIQTQVASAVYNRKKIIENDVEFIPGLQVAEDAIFNSFLILASGTQDVGVVDTAKYFYRARASKDSAVNTYKHNPDFYFGRFIRGYLPLLERAESTGSIPIWLQMLVLYDLRWYFPRELENTTKATHLNPEEKAETLRLVQQILTFISSESILLYRVTGLAPEIRALWLTLKSLPLPTNGVARIGTATPAALEVRFLFQVEPKVEVFGFSGPAEILNSKTRCINFFDQQVLKERILWIKPLEGLQLKLNGVNTQLRKTYGFDKSYKDLEWQGFNKKLRLLRNEKHFKPVSMIKQKLKKILVKGASKNSNLALSPAIAEEAKHLSQINTRNQALAYAQKPKNFHRLNDVWIFMDSLYKANDNSEYLYEYVRKKHTEQNICFVLKKDSKDWQRLRQKEFKLIAYGSKEHLAALFHAEIIFSSHLDEEIVKPIPEHLYPEQRPWLFVYLQHGILQHNLSNWFNKKDISLFTTATADEHQSIVQNNNDYRLTEQTVKLTGFPRHDHLQTIAREIPWSDRNRILIAPTWRNNLFKIKETHGQRRKLLQSFENTDYGKNLLALLNSRDLFEFSQANKAELVFLPHPAFRGLIDPDRLPDHVSLVENNVDLHNLLVSARVTVTDYSSIFFDAAVAGSQVTYFQFDQSSYFNGDHTYTKGYWSYEDHGFGPISTSVETAVEDIIKAFNGATSSKYKDRISSTMTMVDGKASSRIIEHVADMLK